MTDDEVIAALTQVKGIGRWSAEMFLMFRLHRPDVLPVGDLGIVNAMQNALRPAQEARRRIACARSARRGGRTAPSPPGTCGEASTTSRRPASARRYEDTQLMTLRRLSLAAIVLAVALSRRTARSRRPRRRRSGTSPPISDRRTKLAFDTSEGTWMNVDVSPDGKRDRLRSARRHLHHADRRQRRVAGDAASRAAPPSTCSRASAPTASASRSPAIATACGTSGRWTSDGKNAKQVSREKRWFVNSPTWSPDGSYIFARRHFVTDALARRRRDLDVPRDRRPTACRSPSENGWQKDAGEPAVSPDGRYLYYSKDVTPGQTFEYNKDPNGTIYAIIRRDLTTGRERRLVSVQGGSVTPRRHPTASRSPTSAACACRASCSCAISRAAAIARVFDHLDKDLQEAWAVHGVYPQYAWMPDGKSIVIWGEGKIWRVDVGTGAGRRRFRSPRTSSRRSTTRCAFRRRSSRRRVPGQDAARRACRRRTASTSSTARSATSMSRRCPTAQPKRAHDATTRFEFFPSFSRDGQWIVYTTWTDAELRARPRHAARRLRRTRRRRRGPGTTSSPSFSPDGKTIVFRDAGGDDIARAALRRRRRHLRGAGGRSATPRLVRDGGIAAAVRSHRARAIYRQRCRATRRPCCSASASAIRLAAAGRATKSCTSSRQRHAVRAVAGRQVDRVRGALASVRRAVSAHRPPGRLRSDDEGYPAARISRDAGFYLHWSGDSTTVYWTLGPELFTRDLARTFTFLDRQPRRSRDEPEAKGIPIGFTRQERRAGRRRSRSSARASSRRRWPADPDAR